MDSLEELTGRVARLEAQVAGLSGPHVELVAQEIGPQGEMVSGPHADVVVAEGPPPGQSVADWISSLGGSPGFVVDPGLARGTPCIITELGEGRQPLIWSKGIRGALDEDQKALYCQEGFVHQEMTEAAKERLHNWEQSSHYCSASTEHMAKEHTRDHLDAFLSCMGKELRAKGIEVW